MARILIVEDEPDILEAFARGLSREGHAVETAANGRRAHDLVFQAPTPYDLIITDLFLPKMNGPEFLRAILPVIEHRTPFVVISGMATMIEDLGDLADKAAAVLHKPVDLKTVLETVRTILARPRPQQVTTAPVDARLQILLRQNEDLFQRVRIDALTDLPNRRRWLEDLRVLEANAMRYGTGFTLAVIDIDNFGRFNKLYGLETGDQAIRLVARILRTGCREGDAVYRAGRSRTQPDAYRYGGDEFLVVLAAEDEQTAANVMDRIRQQLADAQAAPGPDLPPEPVTMSVGVAVFMPERHVDAERLFEEAQVRMREAKASGGDTVRPRPTSRYAPAPIRAARRSARGRDRRGDPSR